MDKVIVCPYVQAHLSWQGTHLTIAGVSSGIFLFLKILLRLKKRIASSSWNAAWPGNELNQCLKRIWLQWGKLQPQVSGYLYLHTCTRVCTALGLPDALPGSDGCLRNASIFSFICSRQRENKEQANSLEGLSIFWLSCSETFPAYKTVFLPWLLFYCNTCRGSTPSYPCWQKSVYTWAKLTSLGLKAYQEIKEINKLEASLVVSAPPSQGAAWGMLSHSRGQRAPLIWGFPPDSLHLMHSSSRSQLSRALG